MQIAIFKILEWFNTLILSLRVRTLFANISLHCFNDQVSWSRIPPPVPAVFFSSAVSKDRQSRGLGGVRLAHSLSIVNKYLISSKNSFWNIIHGSWSLSIAHWRVFTLVTFPSSFSVSLSFSFNSGSSVSGETSSSGSDSPNSWLNRCFDHTMQCIGSDGVFLMVQPGKVFWWGFSWQS